MLNIKFYCRDCHEPIIVEQFYEGKEYCVNPCENCLEISYEEGEEAGYADGVVEGESRRDLQNYFDQQAPGNSI